MDQSTLCPMVGFCGKSEEEDRTLLHLLEQPFQWQEYQSERNDHLVVVVEAKLEGYKLRNDVRTTDGKG